MFERCDGKDLAYVTTRRVQRARRRVMVPHRALVNYVWWAVREYEVAEGNELLYILDRFRLTITSLFCRCSPANSYASAGASGIERSASARREGR